MHKLARRNNAKRQRFHFACGECEQIAVFGQQKIRAAIAREFEKYLIVGVFALGEHVDGVCFAAIFNCMRECNALRQRRSLRRCVKRAAR